MKDTKNMKKKTIVRRFINKPMLYVCHSGLSRNLFMPFMLFMVIFFDFLAGASACPVLTVPF
jgi:hypothetical protein